MISLPKWAQPPVRYQICTVRRPGADTAGAAAFIKQVTGKAGRGALKAYGFGLPPREMMRDGARLHRAARADHGDRARVPGASRSSRSSPRCRSATSPGCSGRRPSATRCAVTLRTNLIANALILGFGTPTAWLHRRAGGSAGARWSSRSSSCRSCCRRRWPGSACSPRSAPAVCSAPRCATRGSCCPSPSAAVVLAVTFVASPFYIRQAISSFEAVDPNAHRRRAHAGRRRRGGRSGASGCRWPPAACWPAGCWPSPAGWGSSGRRSSSPATCAGRRRR